MEIKLRTSKGPIALKNIEGLTQAKSVRDSNTQKSSQASIELKPTKVDHGLDEKNLLSVFSTLFRDLINSCHNISDPPSLSLLSSVMNILEEKYRPHMTVLVKSQVENTQRSS